MSEARICGTSLIVDVKPDTVTAGDILANGKAIELPSVDEIRGQLNDIIEQTRKIKQCEYNDLSMVIGSDTLRWLMGIEKPVNVVICDYMDGSQIAIQDHEQQHELTEKKRLREIAIICLIGGFVVASVFQLIFWLIGRGGL